MVIIGIDPGTTSIGYALLNAEEPKPVLRQAGLIKIRPKSAESGLKELHLRVSAIIKEHSPAALALERLFFAKNAKTAMAVSEARGVILLTASLAGLKVFEYTPQEIKKAVTGNGRADKTAVKKMLNLILEKPLEKEANDDVYDAAAAAITCAMFFRKENRSTL